MALCALFVPGDRHILFGTKTGLLCLFDVSTSLILDNVEVHSGPIWSMSLRPDKTGFVTGSGDKEVKFWDFELVGDEVGVKFSFNVKLFDSRSCNLIFSSIKPENVLDLYILEL